MHGGALSKSFHYPFQQIDAYAKDAKKEMARKTLSLIQNNMNLLASGGTTMIELARMIPDSLNCTFFTVSPPDKNSTYDTAAFLLMRYY